MKTILNYVLVLILCQTSSAQVNLVPNPSFEMHDTCDLSGPPGTIQHAIPWYSPTTGTPDYYNSCTSFSGLDVPTNFIGFQFARTGNAYAGIVCYDTSTASGSSWREYIQVELIDSLIPQNSYCIKFFVSSTFNNSYGGIAISEIGMYLSNNGIVSNSAIPLIYTPQIISPVGVYFTDTANWAEISGIYVAHGGERYITIGNFKWNLNTDTAIQNNNSQQFSYYYVDDVSVVDCTNQGVQELGIGNEELEIYPNPCASQLEIRSYELGIKEVKIYDVVGQLVYSSKINNTKTTIDISSLAKGVYFVEVGNKRKRIVKE